MIFCYRVSTCTSIDHCVHAHYAQLWFYMLKLIVTPLTGSPRMNGAETKSIESEKPDDAVLNHIEGLNTGMVQ